MVLIHRHFVNNLPNFLFYNLLKYVFFPRKSNKFPQKGTEYIAYNKVYPNETASHLPFY